MPLFESDLKTAIKRVSEKPFESHEQRDEFLTRIRTAEGLKARDVMWMLFRPDRAVRETAIQAIKRARDPETLDVFLGETRGKTEAAIRAAALSFASIGVGGVESRIAQLLQPQAKDTKEARDMQQAARRLALELPLTAQLEQILWQLESAGDVEERLHVITRLTASNLDARNLPRWTRLASDGNDAIRGRALEFLAQKSPAPPIELFVQQLPNARYATQQILIEALTRAAAAADGSFVDQLLPLVSSSELSTRTAVLKILIGLKQPKQVIRKYLQFAKTLAPFIRDRVLDSLRAFGDELVEPVIELLNDRDEGVRGAAIALASTFDDPRVVPATISLLRDSDWWIRVAATDALGKLKDPRAVEPLVAMLADPDLKWSAIEALGRIGDHRALNSLGRMLSDPKPDVRIEVMHALKRFDHPQVTQALMKMAQSDPERFVRTRAVDILDEIAKNKQQPAGAEVDALRNTATNIRVPEGEKRLNALLIATRNQGASDFHLAVGQPPIVRVAADLLRARGDAFTAEQSESLLKEILSPAQIETLDNTHQLDFCYYIRSAGRYRGNIFRDHRGYSGVFRVIPEKPPTMNDLGLPSQLSEIADYHQGLVLVCGPSGSGKSTTLAALVNLFNETRNDHVLTMEDPVEFVHPFKNCLINQREVGRDTKSFARALRAALREDPDVIVIGELRDNESVALALTAAETGHIVLGTINSTGAAKAIDRIIGSFPVDDQPQIRASLSESMKYIVAQRLLPSKQSHKQVAAFEVLKGTSTIANMIRDEKTFQIHSAMQIGRSQGMQTFDEALRDLLRRDQITPETAYKAAMKKEDFEALVSPEFISHA